MGYLYTSLYTLTHISNPLIEKFDSMQLKDKVVFITGAGNLYRTAISDVIKVLGLAELPPSHLLVKVHSLLLSM